MHTTYGVATISRLLKIIGLFCKRALQKRRYSAKETYNFKEPTTRSHPMSTALLCMWVCEFIRKYIYVHTCTFAYLYTP